VERIKTRIIRFARFRLWPRNRDHRAPRARASHRGRHRRRALVDQIAFVTHNADFHIAKFVYDLLEAATRASSVSASTRWPTRPTSGRGSLRAGERSRRERVVVRAGNDVFAVSEELPEAPEPAPSNRDFSRFLKRGPDSSATETLRPVTSRSGFVERPLERSREATPRPQPGPAIVATKPFRYGRRRPSAPAPIPGHSIPTLTKPMES